MDESPQLLGHIQRLQESIHIASIADVLQPTIAVTRLPLGLPLLRLVHPCIADHHFVVDAVDLGDFEAEVRQFLDLIEELLRELAETGKAVFVDGVDLDDAAVGLADRNVAGQHQRPHLQSQHVHLFSFEPLSVAEADHEQSDQFEEFAHIVRGTQGKFQEVLPDVIAEKTQQNVVPLLAQQPSPDRLKQI